MPDPAIAGLTQDSRKVRPGYLFAALPGARDDGTRYITDAVRNGAVAVLTGHDTVLPPGMDKIAIIRSDCPRRDISLIAARFYRRQPAFIAAVTGTNGKTSTAHFAQQIWQESGLTAASLGTLGVRSASLSRAGSMTTPDPVTLHAELADLDAAGITHLAVEASSHGLDQHRLDGVAVGAAGFTNLTRDHLDYHATMDGYRMAKTRLFADILQPGGTAVLNADVPEFAALKALCARRDIRVAGYGMAGDALKIVSLTPMPHGQRLVLDVFGVRHDVVVPLVGSFMVMNALCALGLAMAGSDAVDVSSVLSRLQGAPGRLQLVAGHPRDAAVYVDYAHTPDALENVLAALRPHTQGRLVCLFGCGGDRDAGKRPVMGAIAGRMADSVIVTDDNPRSEDPESIRKAVSAGVGAGALIIGDRRAAIRQAIADLKHGDVLVIAGKGHEQGQIFADRVDPFDDVHEAENAINAMTGKTN